MNEEELQELYLNSYLESNFYPRSFVIINYKQFNFIVSVNIHQNVIGDIQKISLKVFSSNHFDLANCLSHGGSLNALIEMIYQAKQGKSSVLNKCSKTKSEDNLFSKKLKLQASIKSTYELCQPILVNGKHNSKALGNSHSNEGKHDKFTSSDAICSICISNTVSSRLEPCKHLFCDHCLNEHIEDCIFNRATEVTFPEFKCNFSLNIASVMKYVKSNALFKIYYNKRRKDR